MQHILSIAGSDSCAGAGIQADMKTMTALGTYGLTVITAVTAQNTRGVTAIQEIEPSVVQAQLEAIFSDIRIDAIKIGMLSSPELIKVIAEFLSSLPKLPPLVLDPVMVAKSGDRLLKEQAIDALVSRLFPLCQVLTPNIPETEMLAKQEVKDVADMKKVGAKLLQMGPRWVVVKGGHLEGDPVDIACGPDGNQVFKATRIGTNNNHGTGCTLSSAIAAYLGQGVDEITAIQKAKDYVTKTLQTGFPIGKGVGILDHFCTIKGEE